MPDFHKQWEIGFPIFKQLFDMEPKELREKLHSICGEDYKELIDNSSITWEMKTMSVREQIKTPYEISLNYYNSITITPFGIVYKPEHGSGKNIISFNEHFKL